MKKLVPTVLALAFLVPAVAMAQQMPIRVGASVKAPARVTYVQPVYPEAAKAANVSGIVIAEIVVSPEGDVTDARILRSITLLDQAALDAVKQWKYTPTTLNGVPVPVIITVTVNFTLSEIGSPAIVGGAIQLSAPAAQVPVEPVYLNGREVMRIGGEVKAPERIRYVAPVYPADAQAARISGIVIIEALIDESGHVAKVKVLRSVLGLDQAAIDAVMQWEYTPTLLNGNAVPVMMTVTVNFTLQ